MLVKGSIMTEYLIDVDTPQSASRSWLMQHIVPDPVRATNLATLDDEDLAKMLAERVVFVGKWFSTCGSCDASEGVSLSNGRQCPHCYTYWHYTASIQGTTDEEAIALTNNAKLSSWGGHLGQAERLCAGEIVRFFPHPM